jgi:nicotinate phosphoribosyltransferase
VAIESSSALLTDLYELTMAAAYFESEVNPLASFELFVRTLPPERSFLVAAGLDQCLQYLEDFRFSAADVAFVREQQMFRGVGGAFFDYLRRLRFTGDVWAVPEGTPIFAGEPLLRVTAPMIEAQIVETFLLSQVNFQTAIATKAARVVQAAQGRAVIEFGTRRAHGPEAGVLAARAAYIGGCDGTSNVEAGRRFGIPLYGTMAHSFVMAFAREEIAFASFARRFPDDVVLLIDTYDTLAAVDKIIRLGLHPQGVRLDSGDLVKLSREVRRRMDAAGLHNTKIFASGDLDEYAISELLVRGAVVDGFGVGTRLATSIDSPAVEGVYKLVELELGPQRVYRAKFSEHKATYPARKQVFRFSAEDGLYSRDIIGRAEEDYPGSEPLLQCVLRNGERVITSPALAEVRERTRRNLARLPERYRLFRRAAQYPVQISAELDRLLDAVRRREHDRQEVA